VDEVTILHAKIRQAISLTAPTKIVRIIVILGISLGDLLMGRWFSIAVNLSFIHL
jgi:hypothetical protein